MTMTTRREVPAPKLLQTPSGQRISLSVPPPSMISDEPLGAAIALHGEMRGKLLAVNAEIKEAETAIRLADGQDLRQRAAAELAGRRDPGVVETDKALKKHEKLADRRLVLVQAQDDAAVAVANLVQQRRTELLEATATELEPVRREYLATIEKLEGLHERMTQIQATRGWMASFPEGRSFNARMVGRAQIVDRLPFADVLEVMRGLATADEISHEVKSANEREAGQSAVKLLGEGDERYPEVNE